MAAQAALQDYSRGQEIDYFLRRAEQESIAAIKAAGTQASERHGAMAQAYSALVVQMLASPQDR